MGHTCTRARAVKRLSVHMCRAAGKNGARKEEGDGEAWGVGQAGGGSHYPPCQLWMELAEDYGTFCKATMGALRIRTHFHPLCFFPSIKQMQLCPCCLSGHLPGRHLEPPTVKEVPAPLAVGIIKGELFTPAGNKTYL